MIFLTLIRIAIASPTLDEIIRKAEESLQYPQQVSEILLTVQKKRRSKEYTLTVYQDNLNKRGAAVFHKPIRDKDTKFLRKEEGLWMYLPSIERTKRISGHMLNQGVMGSDIS